jgi:hypothetical protein
MLFMFCACRVLAMLLLTLVVVLLHVLVVLLLLVGASVNASCVRVAILKYLEAQNLLLFSRWCYYLHWCYFCFFG